MQTPLIFDGHNDLLTRLYGLPAEERDVTQVGQGAIDMPSAAKGGFGGGFFALWVPSAVDVVAKIAAMQGESYDVALPPMVAQQEAVRVVEIQLGIFAELVSRGHLVQCLGVDDLRATLGGPALAAILHMEGAEAIGPDLAELHMYHALGLRSLGPVWSRETIFGHGVPFRYPSTGDTGPGLTDAGGRLVRACDDLGIMLDLSHLNEAGFWDVAKASRRPLVATHSNAWAISPHARNLTDRQLDAIADSDGMVGLNFAVAFLRPDGKMRGDVGLDVMMRHLDHLIERLGEDRVGFGSDYDGAMVPESLTRVADLPTLRAAMAAHGVDAVLMEKLCHRNWLRVLALSWN